MWGLDRALMGSWPRHGAVQMYSLQQVQLVSRPWDRGKSEPDQSLSTDTGNICALLWTYLSSVIYTTGPLVWTSFTPVREVVVFANRVEMSCGQGICRTAYTGFSLNKLARPTLLDREIEIVNECHHVGRQAVFRF